MVEVDIFSCDDLNCHGGWSHFGLFSFACKVAQEGQSWNFPCHMLTPLDLKLGLAISFHMARVLKSSRHFATNKNSSSSSKCFEFKNRATFLLLPKIGQTTF